MRSDIVSLPAALGRSSQVVLASRDGGRWRGAERSTLLPQTESLDDALVALKVASAQIVEHAPTLAHELEQATTGMMVALVRLEVLRQIRDPIGQERDLDLR